MFRSLFTSSRPRPATLDLLTRQDDRLLADIGMTRADLEAVLHRPLPQRAACPHQTPFEGI